MIAGYRSSPREVTIWWSAPGKYDALADREQHAVPAGVVLHPARELPDALSARIVDAGIQRDAVAEQVVGGDESPWPQPRPPRPPPSRNSTAC
jgi:hypothetical protein